MKWFKIHFDYLEKEVQELRSNSNYKEICSLRDNLFVSSGEIIVRLDNVQQYPILIVYPESTPFSLPRVFLLETSIQSNEINEICKLEFNQVPGKIRNNIKIYHRRHQGADGSLCLLEADHLYHERPEVYSVRQVIDRVRDWFAGLTTGKLPQDSPEVEFFSHFLQRDSKIELLLPDILFDDDFLDGKIYAAKNPYVSNVFKDNYICAAITGKNKANIIVQKKYDNPQHLLFIRCPKPDDILKYEANGIEESIKNEIDSGNLIKLYGFEITVEPRPFQNIHELAFYIGNQDEKNGFKRLLEYIDADIGKSDVIYIGLKFPGRRRNFEWQFFSLKKNKDFACIIGNNIETLCKYGVYAIYAEEFTEKNYHKRNSKRAERDILKNKSVTCIGCGALGSEIADIIGKAGIGKIHLVDKECLRAHNSVRHLVSTNRMGLPKVLAVAEEVIMHNPFVDVEIENFEKYGMIDILNDNINSYYLNSSIGISTIADDNVEGFLNEQAVINNKTIFYSRSLRGGKTARIFRVIPGIDACKNCLSHYCEEKDPHFIEIPEDVELPTITNECNNPIRPASAADLKLISSITSRLIIDFLQTNKMDMNHWIWTTEKLENLSVEDQTPFVLHSSFIPPHPKCMYCKKDDPIKVVIDKSALDFMREQIFKKVNVETGGILVGHKLESGDIRVRFASDSGPKAKCLPFYFEKDIVYTQEFIDKKYEEFGNSTLYIGEWHYHPSSSNKPSNTDLLSLSNISTQKEYLLTKPIMIIFSKDLELSVTVHPFRKSYYFAEYSILSCP